MTEVGGHEYPGKDGLQLGAFYRFRSSTPISRSSARTSGAGCRSLPEAPQVSLTASADTAARRFLYPEAVYGDVIGRWGVERLLLGSDFPLMSQKAQIEDVRKTSPEKWNRRSCSAGTRRGCWGLRAMPDSLRLFVAMELPGEVREALERLQHELQRRGLGKLRWVRPEGIHLTLKFLGETPAEKVPATTEALAGAVEGVYAHELALGKLGTFGGGRPRVLWVDLTGDLDAVRDLQERTETALNQLGFEREARGWSPHVTLARVRPESMREAAGAIGPAITAVQVAPG